MRIVALTRKYIVNEIYVDSAEVTQEKMSEVASQEVISIQEGGKGISKPTTKPFAHGFDYEISIYYQTNINFIH